MYLLAALQTQGIRI